MHSATPTPNEPFETALPRLCATMEAVIAGLRARGIVVETSVAFMLDLTACPVQAPQTLDGVVVKVSFASGVPGWADGVRYHFHFRILGQRPWSVYEPLNGFNVSRLVDRIVTQLDNHKRERAERERVARDQALAEERLARLGEELGISQEASLRLAQDNVRIEGVHEAPDVVLITVKTSHANAEKIAREFRVPGRRRPRPV